MKESILQRVAAGEVAAVDECLARYGGLVWSLARRLIRERSSAEDAVQEVFIEIWRKASSYDPARGSEAAFITVLARRRLLDHLRKRQRGPQPVAWPVEEVARGPEVDRAELRDEAAKAAEELAQLRPDERRVLELAIYHGCTQEQIASLTGLPAGTVKTHARRGLIRLRDRLARTSVVEAPAP